MNYIEFLAFVSIQYEEQGKHKELRYGQMYMNALHNVKPKLAMSINGSVNDPFFRDNVPPNVHKMVEENWAIG